MGARFSAHCSAKSTLNKSSICGSTINHVFQETILSLLRSDTLVKKGVTPYTKDGVYDLSNPSDMLLKQIMDAMAEGASKSCIDSCAIG